MYSDNVCHSCASCSFQQESPNDGVVKLHGDNYYCEDCVDDFRKDISKQIRAVFTEDEFNAVYDWDFDKRPGNPLDVKVYNFMKEQSEDETTYDMWADAYPISYDGKWVDC